MFYLQPPWIIAFVFAYVYFNMSKHEVKFSRKKDHAWLWAGLSIAISAFTIRFLSSSWVSVLAAQIVLYLGIVGYRIIMDK
ncbi:MAG: hypothetical protein OQK51_21305 [Kangiellaceae bacterium]|nr:hypothetical protein [Kangiellaceae bacterium]